MKNSENGQSLVEFIIIIPIFFIVLAGIIAIFYLQNRHFIDLEAKTSLSLSSALFEEEEKIIAKWTENNASVKDISLAAFNPSIGFTMANNKADGVFVDKKFIINNEVQSCDNSASYNVNLHRAGKFELTTCADKDGYEKRSFSFQDVLANFNRVLWRSNGASAYYPFAELAWNNRAELVKNAIAEFKTTIDGISFANSYASFNFPNDNSDFNRHCLMEAFAPECQLSPYGKKFDRAAKQGANTQLFSCYSEMLLKCIASTVEMPVCVAAGIVEITASAKFGKKAKSCPIANKTIEMLFAFVKTKSLVDAGVNIAHEAKMRVE